MLRAHATHATLPAGLARAPSLAARTARRARSAAAAPRASSAAATPPPPRSPRARRAAPPPPHVAARIPGPTAVVAAPHAPPHAPHAPSHAHAHAADEALGASTTAVVPPPVPADVLREFEHKLEADLASVGLTLMAVTGVIVFWRGVWSLLDYFMGDSLLGSLSCMVFGLSIVLWLRLSGARVATSFWPPG